MITSLSVQQLFGEGATQTLTTLTITKSSLPKLNPTSNNSAESLLVGILLKVLENFEGEITDESGHSITNELDISITYGNDDNAELMNVSTFNIYLSERIGFQCLTHNLVIHKYDAD
ncbi:hypothetical protein [Calothrix sp. PCC 7507]|uniref:hypothetical protein n=1 Tax=Calothrix sp. PCC 7507 TaxID=99598 RepID=UPI00029F49F3|nr:hypothetical protein [Calothrix sp. PCC 7507]AFY34877.1 hypothetical protein Cal7507_4508 [Calothrix sp. PCC 7507]